MRVLVAIVSCTEHLNRVNACLETWARTEHNSFTVIPFTGRDLGVPDGYEHLPEKVRAVCEFALINNFHYLIKADSDTFLWLDRIWLSGFEAHDYVGWTQPQFPDAENYCAGGPGYILSSKAFECIANAKLTADTCEDRWVGVTLYNAGFKLHRDERYAHGEHRKPLEDTSLLTYHPASPAMMRKLWEASRS